MDIRPHIGPAIDPVIMNNVFHMGVDMHQFRPDEIEVKFDKNNMLMVRGEREIKSTGGKYEYRKYVEHFPIPDSVDHEKLTSKLDGKGILKIQAPLKASAIVADHDIPIAFVDKH